MNSHLMKMTIFNSSRQLTCDASASTSQDATPLTFKNLLDFVAVNAGIVTKTNFIMTAALVLAFCKGHPWAPEEYRKSRKEMQRLLAAALRETENANHNPGRAKRFAFARFSAEIAGDNDVQKWAVEAANKESLEVAIVHLAQRFLEVAKSVTDLARYCGVVRPSGGSWSGSAGHAGAAASTKLTLRLDHPRWAAQSAAPIGRHRRPA